MISMYKHHIKNLIDFDKVLLHIIVKASMAHIVKYD
jgi:hypothetical protein